VLGSQFLASIGRHGQSAMATLRHNRHRGCLRYWRNNQR
jgi:hypothetical protein